MKSLKRDFLKILLIVLLVSGIAYAFFNVLNRRFQGSENYKRMEEVTGSILKVLDQADRLECRTSVYLQLEEENKHDAAWDTTMVHDLKNKRFQVSKGDTREISEYQDLWVYSKGISPVYIKDRLELKKVAKDKWFRYSCEEMYGVQRWKGQSDQISYGYLTDENFLKKIRSEGNEEINEKKYKKYRAVIRNTLKETEGGEESDNEFRKELSAYGLDITKLKQGYPEVYKMLRTVYNRDTEDLYIWVDEEGNLTRIEKDYTFPYYMEVLKENTEKIEDKVGQYGYPKVFCRQDYTYSPKCKNIEMPKSFEEL